MSEPCTDCSSTDICPDNVAGLCRNCCTDCNGKDRVKKDSKVDKAFEKAWGVVKAAPCPQCGAETGERCGKNQRNPANRCKLRRRSMESDRETTPSTWKE